MGSAVSSLVRAAVSCEAKLSGVVLWQSGQGRREERGGYKRGGAEGGIERERDGGKRRGKKVKESESERKMKGYKKRKDTRMKKKSGAYHKRRWHR